MYKKYYKIEAIPMIYFHKIIRVIFKNIIILIFKPSCAFDPLVKIQKINENNFRCINS